MNNCFEKFKDLHRGETCYLIANGPSLKDTNLDLLVGKTTIAMNKISLIYPETKWRPTYYLYASTNVNNKVWGKSWTESVQKSIKDPNIISFVADKFKDTIDPKNKYGKVLWINSISEKKPSLDGKVDPICFSTNIVDRIDKSGTSVNIALQMAYYFGFSNICFVGADLGWVKDTGSTSDPNHFDSSYRADISNPEKANQQMRNIHSLAYNVFKKDKPNVNIWNASKKTVLDIYPIIDLEEFVNGKISLRISDMESASSFWKNEPQYGKGYQ